MLVVRLIAFAALALPLAAQIRPLWPIVQSYTAATLPTFGVKNRVAFVTDAATNASCTVGGGSVVLFCRDDGTAWAPAGDGSSAGGSAITSLTGDVTAAGPGAAAATVTRLNGTALSGLATGLLKNTTGTGVPSIANASDLASVVYATGGGTAQAQTVTLSPAVTVLGVGLRVCWLPIANNTSAGPTLAVNGLTAKTIVKNAGAALIAGDLATTAVACAIYDGSQFELQNASVIPVTGGGTGSATAAAARTSLGVGYSMGASCGNTTLTAATAVFCANFATMGTSEAPRQYVIPVAGTITAIYVLAGSVAPTADATCRVRINEVDQTPAVTIVAAGFAGPAAFSASSPSISVTAGNRLSFSCTGGATTQTSLHAWSIFIQ